MDVVQKRITSVVFAPPDDIDPQVANDVILNLKLIGGWNGDMCNVLRLSNFASSYTMTKKEFADLQKIQANHQYGLLKSVIFVGSESLLFMEILLKFLIREKVSFYNYAHPGSDLYNLVDMAMEYEVDN